MRWMLSGAAAPDASLQGLLDAVATKNLAGVELIHGHEHGVVPGLPPEALEQVTASVRDHGLQLCAYRIDRPDGLDPTAAASFARGLGAPLVLTRSPELDPRLVQRWAESFVRKEARLLLAVEDPTEIGSGSTGDLVHRFSASLGYAWEATPTAGTADQARWMLESLGPALRYVRIPGTGPEALDDRDGRIASMVTVMTLLGYRGPAVLAPSSAEKLEVWGQWLGRRRGWGCGGSGPASRTDLQASARGAP